jgi:predicted Ser/Thr protein kinase
MPSEAGVSRDPVCPKCAAEVREEWRVCPACAAPLNGATQTLMHASASSSASIEEGRFPAGTVLAGRYRVLGLLGRGGMGEVYRAYDLILNQAVALKFLAVAHMGEAALARFRNEVRIARQVSHPNVCRVYDIGFVEGQHFLSMEYLDGEDLDSLLRRIGRLPQDKAIEFARKICAGLSAAHERGVLHRDLKPANIMIDGRGQVRITDFGLAALAQEVALGDIRSGTPAYMAPEQKAGKEVTERSDLFSMGLVLYEMFTGKRRTDTQSNPTDLVKDLDQAVERVILRCLEEDPKRRPSSAIAVAMALPGGDPIAAALAAGETPSPEMVAASAEKEGFHPRTAALCFAGMLVCVIAGAVLRYQGSLLRVATLDIPPEVMAFRAQELLRQFGYPQKPQSTAYGLDIPNGRTYSFVMGRLDRATRTQILSSQQPPVLRFWYRQHQAPFFVDSFNGDERDGPVNFNEPANTEPGMKRVVLDGRGRLTGLDVRPGAEDRAVAERPPDWNALFAATQLDTQRFTTTAPTATPPMAFDSQMAWTGTYREGRQATVHVEAAAWRGRPVFLRIETAGGDAQSSRIGPVVAAILVGVFLFVMTGAALVARHNLRVGRGDRYGAAVVSGIFFIATMAVWAFTAEHVASPWEVHLLVSALSENGFVAAMLWLSYLAIEPYVRRHWPDALISWTRFEAGRLADPLVATHILAGLLAIELVERVMMPAIFLALSYPPTFPLTNFTALPTGSYAAEMLLTAPAAALVYLMGVVLLVVLFRLLVRREWLADLVVSLLMSFVVASIGGTTTQTVIALLLGALRVYLMLWMMRRFGLLAMAAMWFGYYLIESTPYIPGTWFAGRTLIILLTPAFVGAWATWIIVKSRNRLSSEAVS